MPDSCYNNASPNRANPSDARPGVTVAVKDRLIGDGCRAYVIAEAGVNHDGSLARALALVDVAVAAGADAVKFQMFRAAELTTESAGTAAYQRAAGDQSQRQMLARLELSDAAFARLADHCRAAGIEFLATPFSLPDVGRLLALGVPAFKIASTDLDNAPLLRKVAASGLPLIVSTGAATAAEIGVSVDWLRSWGAERRLVLLHCVSSYPTPLEAVNLRAIGALRAAFAVPCGFSDHTTGTQTGGWAVAAGACVVEKHFTLDRGAPGPDHAISLGPLELKEYVAAVRAAEAALGSGALGMTELEAEVRAVARKSVVTASPLPKGTVLTADMLTVKRPGGGIAPDEFETLIGRRVTSDVPPDTLLTWDLIA